MMDKNSVILISGCSSGIGLSLAREFASRGCRVFATARKPEVIEHLKSEKINTLPLDVTDQQSIDACVAEALARAGRIDVLVNNAGYALIGPIIDLSIDDLRREFETNVIGLVALTKAVAPQMIERKSGLVVNIASVSGICATPFAGAYCATKAAVNLLSVSMRIELAPFGIAVVTVQPGAIKSKFGEAASNSIKLREDSVYAPVAGYIQERATSSQKNPTKAEEFSRKLVDSLFLKTIPKVIRLGRQSTQLPLVAALPADQFDHLMSKTFGLKKLARK
ncbi:MAG TPA: SDR family oxidoreductase [Smithellaceae bacterium]|nr:SDR family oxidoreductase [Smithella sp.]HNZ10878.1 SDR family oxidoreductase [Smithellaceae bacterium]HOQ41956.1 SDR family oxidoreductase [Smithellaceae bacterium]HPL66615.1 SDR family oxidoreductase [Smithellaceae bacterium]HQP24459.1 SDR family oxidoreductase [Smithellaceae bacterium]